MYYIFAYLTRITLKLT